MTISLLIDTAGGSNFEGYGLRNVGSLHVGGSASATETLDVTGTVGISSTLKVDTVAEFGAGVGITLDGVLLKDSIVTANALLASSDDSGALGASGTAFSDLFLASGGVINWSSGDVTITHSAAKLTLGGDGAVEIDFNNHEMTNVDINSGAIDGTVIGGASAAAGGFTTLAASSTSAFTGNMGIGQAAEAQALGVVEADNGVDAVHIHHTGDATPFGVFMQFDAAAPDDTTQYFLRMDDSAGLQAVIYSDGAYQGSANSYGALSDRQLKQNIEVAGSNWDSYRLLEWVDFEYTKNPGKRRHGLVAQDVIELFPDCVYEDGISGMLGLNYMGIATETGKTVQECQARIEVLEAEVKLLKAA